jgi:hypothetical protein
MKNEQNSKQPAEDSSMVSNISSYYCMRASHDRFLDHRRFLTHYAMVAVSNKFTHAAAMTVTSTTRIAHKVWPKIRTMDSSN